MSGPTERVGLWVPDDLVWEAADSGVKLPTFTRAIVRKKPPPDPAGLKTASQEALSRWQQDSYRFPPYVYEEKFLLTGEDGTLRKIPADSKELLMGFKRNHTKKLDRELYEKTPWQQSEDERQSALGNSFHTSTVALILGTLLFDMGFLKKALSPDELLQQLISEHLDGGGDSCESVATPSLSSVGSATELEDMEADEKLMLLEGAPGDVDEAKIHERLMAQLVHQFLRIVEVRGSDIRLDTSVVFKPSAVPRTSIDPSRWAWKERRSFRWRRSQHINLLGLSCRLQYTAFNGGHAVEDTILSVP